MVTQEYIIAMAMLALMIASAGFVIIGGLGLILIVAGITTIGLFKAGMFFTFWSAVLLATGWWFAEAAE